MSILRLSSVAQLCLTLCDPMDCSTPGLPVHHQLPESTQTHVQWASPATLTCFLITIVASAQQPALAKFCPQRDGTQERKALEPQSLVKKWKIKMHHSVSRKLGMHNSRWAGEMAALGIWRRCFKITWDWGYQSGFSFLNLCVCVCVCVCVYVTGWVCVNCSVVSDSLQPHGL